MYKLISISNPKYLKYKIKYLNLKNQYGGSVIDRVTDEGDDLVQYYKDVEYSRFNTITKEVKHWYAIQMMNIIYAKYDFDKPIKILVLGVALGGVIIHLLNNKN